MDKQNTIKKEELKILEFLICAIPAWGFFIKTLPNWIYEPKFNFEFWLVLSITYVIAWACETILYHFKKWWKLDGTWYRIKWLVVK